jgi:succinoglycan biosynthesis transport protein ExoP
MNAVRALPDGSAPLTIAALLVLLRRRASLILWPTLFCLAAAALSCLFATPRYRATAEIQVQKEDGGAFGLESDVSGLGVGQGSHDSLDYNTTLQTETAILNSPVLALRVIEETGLEQSSDYFGAHGVTRSFSPMFWRSWVPKAAQIEPLSVPLSRAPNRRYMALKIFAAHAKVVPLAGTRLIDISYTDPSPESATRVANAMARTLADIIFQQRFDSTLQGSSWLSGQLTQLRRQTEEAQARAVALQRGTGVYGDDASHNVVLERLDNLNQTLTAAESNRILKESIDRVATSASPELISSLSGNSSSGAVASINTSLTLLQDLRAQEAAVRASLAEDSVRYGPRYPAVKELKAQLAGIDASIAAETSRLGARAHTDWMIARREESGALAAFDQQKRLAMQQNDSVIAYQLARQEAESSRALYEGIVAKLKQATLLAGIRSNNVTVLSPATEPSVAHPASPNVGLRLAAALGAGSFAGLCWAMFREATDASFSSIQELETMLGVPLLALLPAMSPMVGMDAPWWRRALMRWSQRGGVSAGVVDKNARPAVQVIEQRASLYSEGMRSLRTALHLSRGGAPPQVLLVTSCLEGEGKTTIAVNLAALLVQGGARVLLVDADLRRPALHTYVPGPVSGGLALALSGPRDAALQQPFPTMPNLLLLSGADIPPYPCELIGSARMRELIGSWRASFDFILLDSPPVLPVSDARLLSEVSDATLLVVRHRKTPRHSLRRAITSLQKAGDKSVSIGVVLNDVSRNCEEFHQYFGYEGRTYAEQAS